MLECHKALPPELWREVLSFGGQQESADLVRASLSCQHPHRLSLHGRAAQRYLTQEPHDAHRATMTHHLHLFRLPGDSVPLLFLPPNLRSLSLAYARCPLQALPPLPACLRRLMLLSHPRVEGPVLGRLLEECAQSLRELSLVGSVVGTGGWSLAGCPHLRALGCPSDGDAASAESLGVMLGEEGCPPLESLSLSLLSVEKMPLEGLVEVLRAAPCPLRALSLSTVDAVQESASQPGEALDHFFHQALAPRHLSEVRSLHMQWCAPWPRALALELASRGTHLRSVHLHSAPLDALLRQEPLRTHLEDLSLLTVRPGDLLLGGDLPAGSLPVLRSCSLLGGMEDRDVAKLLDAGLAQACPALRTLDLRSNELGKGSPDEVAQLMRRLGCELSALTSLSLSDNVALGDQGALALVEGLCERGARLQWLGLAACGCSEVLAEGLVRSRLPVACLDLSTLQLGGGIPLRAGAVRKLSRVPGLRKLVVQNRGVALERMMHAEEEHIVYITTHMGGAVRLKTCSFLSQQLWDRTWQ